MKIWIILLFAPITCEEVLAQSAEISILQKQLLSVKDSSQYVDVLNSIGTLYYLKSVDSCFYYATKAKTIADRIDYTSGKAGALKNLGLTYIGKNNYQATGYFNESLNIYKSLEDSVNMCLLLNNLGVFNPDDSVMLDYYYKAYRVGIHLSKDSVLALVIANIISKDTSLSKEKVKELFIKGLSIAEKYKGRRMLLVYKETEAELLFKDGKKKEAVLVLDSAIKYAGEIGCEYEKLYMLVTLGEMLMKDSAPKAIACYEEALKIAGESHYPNYIISVSWILCDYYTSMHNPAKALYYANIEIEEYERSEQALKQSGFTYMNYVLKNNELEDAKMKNKLRKNIITILCVLTVVSLGMLFFMFRSYKNKNKLSVALQKLNDAVLEKNKVLETNNAFNNKLISIIAHDLRQPFASIMMMSRSLEKEGPLTVDEVEYMLKKMAVESDKSIQFMDGLLKWMKLQMAGFEYNPQPLDIGNIINEAIDFYQQPIKEKNLKITINGAMHRVIKAEKEMLLFVTRNLLSNAVKFSPAHANISINVTSTQNEIVVAFKDLGPGMTSEQLERLFHYQDTPRNKAGNIKGAGIALIISYDMMVKMNGRIWCESEFGKGAVFYYTLPVES